MILLKFTKTENAAYLPHLDMMRVFNRTIRRAGLHIDYSAGYNPHMLLYFCQPIPIGTKSEAEYCVVVSDEDAQVFKTRFNQKSIKGVKILEAKYIEKNINLASISAAAEYELVLNGIEKEQVKKIEDALKNDELWTTGQKPKQVRQLVYMTKFDSPNVLRAVLASGNTNLRADRFVEAIFAATGISNCEVDIVKKKLYTIKDKNFVEIY